MVGQNRPAHYTPMCEASTLDGKCVKQRVSCDTCRPIPEQRQLHVYHPTGEQLTNGYPLGAPARVTFVAWERVKCHVLGAPSEFWFFIFLYVFSGFRCFFGFFSLSVFVRFFPRFWNFVKHICASKKYVCAFMRSMVVFLVEAHTCFRQKHSCASTRSSDLLPREAQLYF